VLNFNDAIVAGWSIMSGGASPERAKSAIDSAIRELYKPKDRMILLFNRMLKNEVWGGSLQAYPFGSRENWAQYTHGSQWLALGALKLGYGDIGYDMLMSMMPTSHMHDPRYGGEPNAVAADISGAHKMGEAGWTWYSGGPGWLYRNTIETVLGLKFNDGKTMKIQPTIPTKWNDYQVSYKHGRSTYEISVDNSAHVSQGVKSLIVDGVHVDPDIGIALVDDGKTHKVQVIMGPKTP